MEEDEDDEDDEEDEDDEDDEDYEDDEEDEDCYENRLGTENDNGDIIFRNIVEVFQNMIEEYGVGTFVESIVPNLILGFDTECVEFDLENEKDVASELIQRRNNPNMEY